jgi:hypothetical protein
MNRAVFVAVAGLLLSAACQRDEFVGEQKTFAEDSLAVAPPEGWEVKHQKDTLVFVGGKAGDSARPTIAIRSVPVEEGPEMRTAETVLPALETVLRALPEATVSGPTDVEHPAYRALAYQVVFTPRSRGGTSYQRRHVVLFANEHIYHAFVTAPDGELEDTLDEFKQVLASLGEEV